LESSTLAPARQQGSLVAIAVVLLAALIAGGLLTRSTPLHVAAVLLGVPLCLRNARVRLLWVIVGGLFVLQSSQELDATKVAYFIVAIAALVGAARNAWRLRQSEATDTLEPVLRASALFMFVVIASVLPALLNGTSLVLWFRDAAPYGLFAASSIFVLDAHAAVSRRDLLVLLVTLGILASASFSLFWLDRRHFADLSLTKLLLPSGPLATALFCYAMSAAVMGHRRLLPWVLTAAFVAAAILVTGTRSGLLLAAAPIAVVLFGPRAAVFERLKRLATISPVLVGATTAFVFAIGLTTGTDIGLSIQRLASVTDVVPPLERVTSSATAAISPSPPVSASTTVPPPAPASVGSPSAVATPQPSALSVGTTAPIERIAPEIAAQSSTQRALQGQVAWHEFSSSPIVGRGPGRIMPWVDEWGVVHANFWLDTPLSFPAKFGIIGILALAAYVASVAAYVGRVHTIAGWTAGSTSLIALAAVWTATLPLTLPLEDKGFTFGLVLLLALSLPERSATAS
jgi:hypothetical protein